MTEKKVTFEFIQINDAYIHFRIDLRTDFGNFSKNFACKLDKLEKLANAILTEGAGFSVPSFPHRNGTGIIALSNGNVKIIYSDGVFDSAVTFKKILLRDFAGEVIYLTEMET